MSTPAQTAIAPAAVPPGTWKLAAGRAMSLRPREAFVLTIAQGCVWATLDGPHRGSLRGLGDHVLEAGDRLTVAPGRRLVIETWGAPARFAWDPVPVAVAQPVPGRASIAEALIDLRHALGLVLGAAARLAAALAGRRPAARPDNCGHGASQVFPA